MGGDTSPLPRILRRNECAITARWPANVMLGRSYDESNCLAWVRAARVVLWVPLKHVVVDCGNHTIPYMWDDLDIRTLEESGVQPSILRLAYLRASISKTRIRICRGMTLRVFRVTRTRLIPLVNASIFIYCKPRTGVEVGSQRGCPPTKTFTVVTTTEVLGSRSKTPRLA